MYKFPLRIGVHEIDMCVWPPGVPVLKFSSGKVPLKMCREAGGEYFEKINIAVGCKDVFWNALSGKGNFSILLMLYTKSSKNFTPKIPRRFSQNKYFRYKNFFIAPSQFLLSMPQIFLFRFSSR